MKKLLIVIAVLIAIGGAGVYYRGANSAPTSGVPGQGQGGGRGGRGAGFASAPMTVELAPTSRVELAETIMVVGNLVGAATVDVVPKVSGRLESISVRIGDRVSRGQQIAKLEDYEIREQVKQAQASFDVASATVRQREADLKFSETTLERARSLASRKLLPTQSLDDAQARFEAANAQLDLSKAQFAQSRSRLEELRITLGNTEIVSPVDGFIGKRNLDPGAFVSPNAPLVSAVDIHVVRLVANLVERDLRRVRAGMPADVEVDAFPGELFRGEIARIAPVLDPATRTAQMEVEVPNAAFRLKPGMYARVRFVVERRANALAVPRTALVDVEGQRGVFLANDKVARFRKVTIGLQDEKQVEVLEGIQEGDRVVTTGAGALKDGDPILLAGQTPGERGGAGGRAAGRGNRGRGAENAPGPRS